MKNHIQQLWHISNKQQRLILGLMSGTSLDGLDIALCRIEGSGPNTRVTIEQFVTVDYDDGFRHNIQKVFARREVDLQELTLLNGWVADYHARQIMQTLNMWNLSADAIDLIASHGQTIYHAPREQHGLPEYGHGTLQIGDGDRLACTTGIITLSDFRQKHIAAGGEGAPLAVYGDFMVFGDKAENRVLLNMGGIANFTFLPAGEDAKGVFSTDVGPGNTMLDAFVSRHFSHLRYDKGGQIAASGQVHDGLLHELLRHDFFSLPLPKTTGPEVFNLQYLLNAQLHSQTRDIPIADVVRTLTEFSARAIAEAILTSTKGLQNIVVYASGGGVHNPVLMDRIATMLGQDKTLNNLQALGVSPDAKEALLFAVLANEAISGSLHFAGNKYGIPDITMGKISLP